MLLQWGRDRAVPEMDNAINVSETCWIGLQWGRDRAVPEIKQHGSGAAWFNASMGPGPRGPGNVLIVSIAPTADARFNGAGTARSRKWTPPFALDPGLGASMGPGPRGPGNRPCTLT